MARELSLLHERQNIRLTVEVKQLQAKLEQAEDAFSSLQKRYDALEKEANLLAEELAKHECAMTRDCPYGHSKRDVACTACMREQAKRWAKND